jgi:hypothetical protein
MSSARTNESRISPVPLYNQTGEEFFELSVPERYNEVTILEHQPSATRCGRRPRH